MSSNNIFYKNITVLYGEKGQQWQLTDLKLVPNLFYNYVLLGQKNGESIVLKLSCDHEALQHEAAALQFYDGKGAVRLLATDFERGALLLERAIPGHSLKNLFPGQDEQAIKHAVEVMKKLHTKPAPSNNSFKTTADWLQDLYKKYDIPEKHLEKARKLAEQLLKTAGQSVLLHGDLHHDNILLSDREGWLVIDPKGIIGEPAYEVGAFIRNPMPELLQQKNPAAIIARRLELFSQYFNIDKERLKNWSYVQAILAAGWAFEDNAFDPQKWLAIAEVIDE